MNKNIKEKSRRSFLTFGKSKLKKESTGKELHSEEGKEEIVKMLTPDGKLVEIRRSVIDNCKNRKKASNREILLWAQDNSSRTK